MPVRFVSRRAILGTLLLGAGGGAAYFAYATRVSSGEQTLTPPQALQAVAADELILVDVRRPDEWERTGSAPGALRIDMRRPDFIDAVRAASAARPGRPVAFICARGVRSRVVTERLHAAGVDNLIDVPEGMLGSRAGPGWLARGLPVVKP